MRILHLLASPVFSGPAESLLLLARAQRELGHEVTVAVDRKRPGLASEEPIVPRFREAGLLDDRGLELSVKSLPWAMAQDGLKLRRADVDVVHSHFSHDHVLARWSVGKRRVLVRSIHAPRSFRALPSADAYTVPTLDALRLLPSGSPAIYLPAFVAPGFSPPKDRAMLQRRLGVAGAPLIGMVSTFQPSRNHLLALDAFALLTQQAPEARLVLVGDGECEERLRARVVELALESRVHFAGYRSGPAFIEWLQAMDQVWVLGLGNDWSGRVAAQARACGVRTVTVDQGALADHADVLLPPNPSPRELAAASGSTITRPRLDLRPDDLAAAVISLYGQAGAPT